MVSYIINLRTARNSFAYLIEKDNICQISAQISDYYTYGLPHRNAVNADTNRNKFGGKEYMTELGLDECDYVARRYDPLLCHFTTPDPLASGNLSISPWAFCNGDPINFIDPTGKLVIYNKSGEYMGHSSEGFNGDVYIYTGGEQVDFSQFTESEIINNFEVTPFDSMRGGCLDSERLSGEAMSKIWTHIVSQFEGLNINLNIFSVSSLKGESIGFAPVKKGFWLTEFSLAPSNNTPYIYGDGSYPYESTVENIASSVIVHEWYSHGVMHYGGYENSHRFAFKNVIDYKRLWDKTTPSYKYYNLDTFQDITYEETGNNLIPPLYFDLYNKYVQKWHK